MLFLADNFTLHYLLYIELTVVVVNVNHWKQFLKKDIKIPKNHFNWHILLI